MKKLIFVLLAGVAILQGCSSDGFKTADNGLKYKIYTNNEGAKIQEGDYVALQMVYRTDSDSVLFDTWKVGRAVQLVVQKPAFKGDLMDGLMLLTEKDSATFLISSDSIFTKTFGMQRPAFIREGSFLTFLVKVEKVKTKAQMEEEMKKSEAEQADIEKKNMAKYISDNKLSPTVSSSGLNYVIRTSGKGEKAVPGDTVVVHYEGRLLNGEKFDSSYDKKKPSRISVGTQDVFPGFDEALMTFNKGTKATVIVPFALAYGAQNVGNGLIPPYSTMVFNMEILEVIKK